MAKAKTKKTPRKSKPKTALAGDKMLAAKALIREAEEKSTQECWKEVAKVLGKHGCKLVARPVFIEGGNGAFAVSAEAGIGVIR